MTTILNPQNYNHKAFEGQRFSKPSLTVPDQTMSVKQILARHAQGLPITGAKGEPQYNPEGNGVDIRTLDLSEVYDLKIATQRRIEELKASAKAAAEEAKKQAAEARKKELEEFALANGFKKVEDNQA